MRVVIALLAFTGVASADDGFAWDPPPPQQWSFHGMGIIQGKPAEQPWSGFGVGIDHRLDGRVWGGFVVAMLITRELEEPGSEMMFPLQTATFAAATTRVQLGEWELNLGKEDGWFAIEARGELGTAFVTKEKQRTTPAIGATGLNFVIGSQRTRGVLGLGYAFTFAGTSAIEPGGIDVRMGITRSW